MNSYAKHTIHRFHGAYTDRSFDQDDVALFLVLARDYAKKGTVLRELGDFLAHSQEKDRGLTLTSVEALAQHFEEDYRKYFKDPASMPVFDGIGTDEALIGDLQDAFVGADLPRPKIGIDDDGFREFLFCVICLLGDCKVKYDGRVFQFGIEYSHSFSLHIRYEARARPRHFAVLPLLQIRNVWIECSTLFGGVQHALKGHIARRFKTGLLAAVPFELDDPLCAERDPSTLPRGSVWPIPAQTR